MSSLREIDAYLWSTVPERIDTLVEKCAGPAWDIRPAISSIYTKNDVSYYWNPEQEKAAVYFRPVFDIEEGGWCKAALDRAVGSDHVRTEPLSLEEVTSGAWIKVAASAALRRVGEALNFFPGFSEDPSNPAASGHTTGPTWMGVRPSPLAAMLTSGLLGSGLGYGAGYLGEKLMPEKWKKGHLRKTLAILGGLAGAAPGAAYALSNVGAEVPWNSAIWQDEPKLEGDTTNRILAPVGYKQAADNFAKKAFAGGTGAGGVLPVNINKLGQTLWEVGASPETAAATMSAVYAAHQLPGGVGPGYVTPQQTGLLGTMMGAAGGGMMGYATGWGVGKALGVLTGMPTGTRKTLNRAGATLGVINSLMPRMFK
jgi:hypothetical protein